MKNYSPMYFLSALGAGGTSVGFFMYLMFMTKHPDTPIPTFNSLLTQFSSGSESVFIKALIIIAIIGILFFAYKHIQLLIWNIKHFNEFEKSTQYIEYKKTNKEVQFMTYPLTLAMTINVAFILGAVFVPNLWSIVEYLFPLALIAFGVVGYMALKTFGEYLSRIISTQSFSFKENNHFGQMMSVFAFVMIGVGFAASTAMSETHLTATLGLLGSLFFMTIGIILGLIFFFLGFKSILKYGINKEMAPSIWIIIPFLTLVGITIVRQTHGIEHIFSVTSDGYMTFLLTTIFISLQIFFGFIGYKVMKNDNYFAEYIHGKTQSPGSFALICPGVAIVVFGFFFLHLGLVKNGIVTKFGIPYFIILAPLVYVQFVTIKTFILLTAKNIKFL